MEQEVKRILRQQLELLAEESKKCDPYELASLTNAMVTISSVLLNSSNDCRNNPDEVL